MQSDTRRKLLTTSEKVGMRVLEYYLSIRERKKITELDKDLVEARSNANNDRSEDSGESSGGSTPDTGNQEQPVASSEPVGGAGSKGRESQGATETEIDSEIDELIEEDWCSLCQNLLEQLKSRPPREQVRGVAEYGEFKRQLSDDADVEELREVLRETDVLQSVFEENLNGVV